MQAAFAYRSPWGVVATATNSTQVFPRRLCWKTPSRYCSVVLSHFGDSQQLSPTILRPRGRGLFDARALKYLRLSYEEEERLLL